jgi:hypothetical protein
VQALDVSTNLPESAQNTLRGSKFCFRRSTFSTALREIASKSANCAPNAFETGRAESGSAFGSPEFVQSMKHMGTQLPDIGHDFEQEIV